MSAITVSQFIPVSKFDMWYATFKTTDGRFTLDPHLFKHLEAVHVCYEIDRDGHGILMEFDNRYIHNGGINIKETSPPWYMRIWRKYL